MPDIDSVIEHLERAGLWKHLNEIQVMSKSNQIHAYMTADGLKQLDWLTKPYMSFNGEVVRLRSGPWWLLHRGLGKKLADYRADNGIFGPGSLQCVVARVEVPGHGYPFYADVDSDSPNMDIWHAVKHISKVVKNTIVGEDSGPQEHV